MASWIAQSNLDAIFRSAISINWWSTAGVTAEPSPVSLRCAAKDHRGVHGVLMRNDEEYVFSVSESSNRMTGQLTSLRIKPQSESMKYVTLPSGVNGRVTEERL